MKYNNIEHVRAIAGAGKSSMNLSGNKTISMVMANYLVLSETTDKDPTYCFQKEGIWYSWLTMWIGNNIKPDSICIDAGAGYGYFSFFLATLGCKVYAFEPQVKRYALMKEAIGLNVFEKSVFLFNKAVANVDGETVMYSHEFEQGLSIVKKWNFGGAITGYENVSAIALDSMLADFGTPEQFSKVDFIKLHINGSEEIAWAGMKKTLAANPQCVILMQIAPMYYLDRAIRFVYKLQKTHTITYLAPDGEETYFEDYSFFDRYESFFNGFFILRDKNRERD